MLAAAPTAKSAVGASDSVFQWVVTPNNVVDSFFCFDAVGALSGDADSPNGAKKPFPGGMQWETWLLGGSGRRAAFITGEYSHEGIQNIESYLTGRNLVDRLMVNEPSDAKSGLYDPSYWYRRSGDYFDAHDGATFPSLPPAPAKPSPTNAVYLVDELGAPNYSVRSMVVCHGSDPAVTSQVLPRLAHHEAAHYMFSDNRLATGAYAKMPLAPSVSEFNQAVDRLLNTHDPEKERAAKLRHPWTVHGVKTIGNATLGYLHMCLDAAKKHGIL